ncbi:hypothetical protein GJ688_14080 [Heliobacillus mobilis]|uniref:Uncharacterized protein n=1 Tax=Heliobacterium mobile TaxID=28064 RepID=A0A6I3SM99_HELMO|nr:hypothetical protein [Heliobacterium mobile]MTV50101.1 hypothetical protein [Heliobacterium mobile]
MLDKRQKISKKSKLSEFMIRLSQTETGQEARELLEVEGKNYTVGQFLTAINYSDFISPS